jgi:hypothetical protein
MKLIMKRYLALAMTMALVSFGVSPIMGGLKDTIQKAIADGKGTINLNSLLGDQIAAIEQVAPKSVLDFLNKLMFKQAKLTDGVPKFGVIGGFSGPTPTGFTLSGVVDFFGLQNMVLNVYNVDGKGLALDLNITKDFRFAQLDSSLKALDGLKVGGIRLIFSTFAYADPKTDLPISSIGWNL